MPVPIVFTRAGVAAAIVAATMFLFPRQHHAQDAVRVEFVRDVQPLLRQHCTSCHGPAQQMAGLRLDRRSAAMRGSTQGTVIGPGNGAASRLSLRVSGDSFGMQMTTTGKLP